MIYLDTSVLGALFFREPNAVELLTRLETAKDAFAVSAWTLTEMAGVGALKERTGQTSSSGRAAALAAFHRFVADSATQFETDPGDYRTAAVLLDAPSLALRAGDALHLAITRRLRASLFTLDRRQADAARHYGITLFA
ncbi:MAG: type II toxin-antitoxin system VapC family toxin [Sulfuritalea sp.]|nr:type II toxin-antitoxin system VapC family toxin [Sulfuritalea sp.]